MLIINSQWVTDNYAKHIQEESLMKQKYKKTNKKIDDYYNHIHWIGIGNTRKRLSNTKNIRIMKYLNRWLNSAQQKGLFGQGSAGQCCGPQEETKIQ